MALILTARCNNAGDMGNAASSNVDSCEIALKFKNARIAEEAVKDDYTGELNNYWGEDTTKLDFKHVFENGKLVKSYFYYENQNVQEEYSFKCAALHGVQKWYHKNGKAGTNCSISLRL